MVFSYDIETKTKRYGHASPNHTSATVDASMTPADISPVGPTAPFETIAPVEAYHSVRSAAGVAIAPARLFLPGRKVRARQDTVVGNAHRLERPCILQFIEEQTDSVAGQGQCHRKHTADGWLRSSQVMVKWCGKSAPPDWRQSGHGKPHRVQAQEVLQVGPAE